MRPEKLGRARPRGRRGNYRAFMKRLTNRARRRNGWIKTPFHGWE